MTIKVTVTNADARETAVIVVQTQDAQGVACLHVPETELKGGQSADIWVHSHQQLVVKELRQ